MSEISVCMAFQLMALAAVRKIFQYIHYHNKMKIPTQKHIVDPLASTLMSIILAFTLITMHEWQNFSPKIN
jgi:hypothetical protein